MAAMLYSAPSACSRWRRPRRVASIALVFLVAVGACAHGRSDVLPSPRRVLPAHQYRPPDGVVGSPALRRLVDLQTARDAAGLVAALSDADAEVRARAAFALASVQDTAAVRVLVSALDDEDARVRADAAFALGQTPTMEGAAALLVRALVEADTTVLVTVLDALGKAGGAPELAGLVAARLVDARAGSATLAAALALAYARFGMRGLHDRLATDWLVAALAADAAPVRENAAYYFARSRDPAPWAHRHRWLVRALDDLGRHDRAAMHLLTGVSRMDDAGDLPRFIDWLATSPDWAIRVNAARAIGRHPQEFEARAALARALDDPSHHVRSAAASALGQAQLTRSEADSLMGRLDRFVDEPAVHGSLLRAIAAAGDTEWVLRRWLILDDVELRRAGLAAVARVPGAHGFDALERAARDPDARLAAAAVDALAHRRALRLANDATLARYFAAYSEALRTRELATASSAAAALADSLFEPLGAGPLLQSVYLQLAAPDDLAARVAIARALGELRDATAVALLRQARDSAFPELRAAAAAALARITGEPAALPATDPAPAPTIQWDWLAEWGSAPRLRLETARGVIVIELSVEQAPLTTQTVLGLALEGRYDGVPFHRVVPNFVIQGGDVERGDGWGGPGFVIRSELTRIPYLLGTAGVASSGKDTEGSQYFVTHSMQPHLDGRYTAFGALVEGVDVLDAIREGDVVIRASALVTP